MIEIRQFESAQAARSAMVKQRMVDDVPLPEAVQARIELAYFNLSERQPELSAIDERLAAHNKARWAVLQAQSQVAV